MRAIWFLIIYISDFIYCICNWEKVIIFSPFTGESILFICLIVSSFLPFIPKIKFGDNELNIDFPDALNNYRNSEQNFKETKAIQEKAEQEQKLISQKTSEENNE